MHKQALHFVWSLRLVTYSSVILCPVIILCCLYGMQVAHGVSYLWGKKPKRIQSNRIQSFHNASKQRGGGLS